jgi:hypothetical protein
MAMTDDQLTDRISHELAIDRALTAAERAAFRAYALVDQFAGAEPADWISEAYQRDAHLDIIEPWMDEHADRVVAELRERHGLPDRMLRLLLVHALDATIAIASADLGERRRTHVEIASDAALWARGYAERCGWNPPEEVTPADGIERAAAEHATWTGQGV